MNDDFLTRFRERPHSEFSSDLYERINKPMTKQSAFNAFMMRRALPAFAALLFLFAAALLSSPSARAFAGSQLRQIGAILFSPVESGAVETAAEIQPTVPAPAGLTARFAHSAVEASGLAEFTVLDPAYLPPGYEQRGTWSVDEQDGSVYVVSTYVAEGGRHFLILNQTRFGEDALFEQRYGENETVTDVMVGENAGVAVSGRLMAHPDQPAPADGGPPELLPTNWLIWEAGGITYTLFSDGLNQAELLQIAESLTE
jgi:hypothetical protein